MKTETEIIDQLRLVGQRRLPPELRKRIVENIESGMSEVSPLQPRRYLTRRFSPYVAAVAIMSILIGGLTIHLRLGGSQAGNGAPSYVAQTAARMAYSMGDSKPLPAPPVLFWNSLLTLIRTTFSIWV